MFAGERRTFEELMPSTCYEIWAATDKMSTSLPPMVRREKPYPIR